MKKLAKSTTLSNIICQNAFDICIILGSLGLYFVLFGSLCDYSNWISVPLQERDVSIKNENIEPPDTYIRRVRPKMLDFYDSFKRHLDRIPLTSYRIVLGEEYTVFITAYCAEECGWNYWTSSGTYCHRASWLNRHTEPTTCAIDRNYFSYGDMFYVPSEDRVYIAEDTGAFRGMWLDLYQDDMSDVIWYPTRYETVYACEIEYYSVCPSYHLYEWLYGEYLQGLVY